MKILFAASEAAPFVKTGGLGDVASALPAALAAAGHDVSVFLPLYGQIKSGPFFKKMKKIAEFETPLSWRRQYTGVYRLAKKAGSPSYYFLDNEYYFKREGRGIYGEYDDGERFVFFSRAILETVRRTGMNPDLIHCNDWQTAALPVFKKVFYPDLGRTGTLFTIHNIEYQGKMPPDFAGDVMGLDGDAAKLVEYGGCVNLMKGAAVCAGAVSTVSRRYAGEILNSYYGQGLEGVLSERARRGELYGIVNGIDTSLYDPATDRAIAANYSAEDISGKEINKRELRKKLGLRDDSDIPLCGMVTRLASHKGIDLVERVIEETANAGVQFAILGTGEARLEEFFKRLSERRPDMISATIGFSGSLASEIYAGSDIFLMPSKSEPCGLSQLVAMRYGAVPVVRETGGLADTVPAYNPQTREGRGFTFVSYNAHDMKDAIMRCASFYRTDRAGFDELRRSDMLADFSWNAATGEYLRIYNKLISRDA